MKKNIRHRQLFKLGLLFTLLLYSSHLFALDPTFMRNGEVYLSLSEAPSSSLLVNGIYRLSDPEGVLGGSYPKYLFKEDNIRNFAVDINRNVFTLSDPKVSNIGSGFMLKRQVLDSSKILLVSPNEGKFSRTGVTDEKPGEGSVVVSEVLSDWGWHAYIHTDHRYRYGGEKTDVYRTVASPGDGTKKRGVKGHWASITPWPHFKALQGKKTSAPASPKEYLPHFGDKNQALVLPHYPGKLWYEIPNGAWFSAWRARATQSSRVAYSGVPALYYQCYRDHATGKQFDWRMVEFNPKTAKADSYTRKARNPFATTYEMSFTRAVLAGCLDGCGGSSGSAGTQASSMIFHAAFMPFSNAAGKPDVTIYSYSRTEGTRNYSLEHQGGTRQYSYVTFGDGAGIGRNDTEWIGVSKGPTQASSAERDYVYYLGTSQIQRWIPQINNQRISAVSVSNQWNEEGGIIFAFDQNSNQIIKFKLKTSNSNNPGVLDEYTTISVANVMKGMKADSSIDDIAADGFGNLYISLTYPSAKASFNVPREFGWTYDNAYTYTRTDNDAGDSVFRFKFKKDYRKSVWKISAMGEPLEEVGAAKIATRYYYRDVTLPLSKASEVPAASSLPRKINDIIIANKTSEGNFIAESFSPVTVASKLAIINAPTPPEVLSLGGDKSYLDIIGAYTDYPVPDPLAHSTGQGDYPRSNVSALNLSTPYYFMVENYPLPGAVQNPNVIPDYDGDGRRGGFVSTIINPHPDSSNIKYVWNLWMVIDHQGNPCDPPAQSNKNRNKSSYFTVFYSPIPAKYVLTCKVNYDWYDYNTVKFGQTIADWKKDFAKNGGKRNSWAMPSDVGVNASGHPRVTNTTTRLNQILNNLFADYKGSDKSSAIASIRSQILNDPDSQYLAFEGIIATGTSDIKEVDPVEVARIQRCNPPNAKAAVAGNWQPRTAGLMNPPGGYHGIDADTTYYWRLDVASQAIFFENLTTETYYNYLADKLMDSKQPAYHVNAKDDFRFVRNGRDLRWDPNGELTLEATLRYPTASGKGFETYPLTAGKVIDGKEGNRNFKYFELEGGTLPPTDPHVATLSIKLTRTFQYDMYIFDKAGNQLMDSPITLPKMLTIEGLTTVIVVDSEKPQILFSKTSPNQLFGETGKLLKDAGNGQKNDKIVMAMTDNNPWEAVDATHHPDYKDGNIAYNKTRLDNVYTENASFNLKPVFNNKNRYFRVYYNVPSSDISKVDKSPYVPGWGRNPTKTTDALTGITAVSELLEDTSAYNKLYTQHILTLPLKNLSSNGELMIPSNYANNSPNYEPLKFFVDASDSSGNKISVRDMNVVLHIKDTIRPMPYGEIVERKNNHIAYIPNVRANSSEDEHKKVVTGWYNDIARDTRAPDLPNTAKEDKAVWSADNTGKVGDYNNREWYALPYINNLGDGGDGVVSLKTVGFNTNINMNQLTPGNIRVEDNVEVFIKAGAVDNAGAAMSKLSFKYFNINGEEIARTFDYPSSWNDDNVHKRDSTNIDPKLGARVIFREHINGDNEEKIEFPLGIPIVIEVKDDARQWDKYNKAVHKDYEFDWGNLTGGAINSNTRTFRTTLPVYGTRLDIRTIDKYDRR